MSGISEGDIMAGIAAAPLDPEAAAILACFRHADVPAWHTLAPPAARGAYRDRADMVAGPATAIGTVADVAISGPAGPLPLRIYHPGHRAGQSNGPLPVLVYIHGGGWTLGDLDTHDEVCRRLSVAGDLLVVAPDYRLAPESPYPAALDDVDTALTWVASNVADHGGDPQRIALGGDSAGGNIAAGLSLRRRDRGQPLPGALVLIYPATEARFDTASYERNAEGKLLTRADCVWFWSCYLGRNPQMRAWSPEEVATAAKQAAAAGGWSRDPYACPGVADDLSGLPPMLVIVGDHDPLWDDALSLVARVDAADGRVKLLKYPGMIHGFVGLPAPIAAGTDAVARIGSWLVEQWR